MRLMGLTLPILLGALLFQVVTAMTKSGVCPQCVNSCSRNLKMDCDSDDNCNGTQKCCQDRCVYSCTDPAVIKQGKCPEPPTPDTCPAVIPMQDRKCTGDQNCTGARKCCMDRCGYSCKEPIVIKPGDCPKCTNPCLGFPIVPVCHGDKDCRGAQKCCRDSCRLICKDPVVTKKGDCPRSPIPADACQVMMTFMNHECDGDQDCNGTQKCCMTSCQYLCKEPVVLKEGDCPEFQTLFNYCNPWMALGGCVSDLQCNGTQKCCKDRCRYICKDPVGTPRRDENSA